MAHNRGQTSLKSSLRNEDPMQDFDRLSQELRAWVAAADLPWRPRSVRKTFERALAKMGSREKAFEELSRIQGDFCQKMQSVFGAKIIQMLEIKSKLD